LSPPGAPRGRPLSPCAGQPTRQCCGHAVYSPKTVLQVITSITAQGATQGTALQAQAPQRQQDRATLMRRFGRQCRGIGPVCVTRVRQTETHVLERGAPVLPLARAAQAYLHGATPRAADQPARRHPQLTAALEAQHRIERQWRRLTPGKAWSHGTSVHAYDPTMAPIGKGTSTCLAQFGRQPGIIAEPAAGCIVALPRPVGPPTAASSVDPVVDHVAQAITRVSTRPTPALPALAGALALNAAAVREALQARGMLPVGIPTTSAPLPPLPTPQDVLPRLDEAALHHSRTPSQVPLRLGVWRQPPRGRTPQGQPAGSWGRAPHRHRPSRRDRPTGDGGEGTPRGHLGAHPRLSSVEASAHVPPSATLAMP